MSWIKKMAGAKKVIKVKNQFFHARQPREGIFNIRSHQCTVDVFAIFSPVFSLRIFYKKHAKNHTSNKPRAFKICVQLSFDKLIWYTKFHKDWSTRRQKHHWSKFFDGLVKYRTENRKTVHCALADGLPGNIIKLNSCILTIPNFWAKKNGGKSTRGHETTVL